MMHGSSSGLRPRQRTFTSCTECRRRKQRCNQAKDRPCNNCSRRYPPVICTYESSSPPPSFDQVVDFRYEQTPRQDVPPYDRGNNVSGPSYMQTPQSDMSDLPATSMSDNNYYDSSRTYYSSTSNPRGDYRSSYAGETSSSQYTPTTTTAGYGPVDAGYHQSGQTSYSSAGPATTHGGYYSSSTQGVGDWLSTNGDPGVFVGAGTTDYYYAYDPDLDDNGPTSQSPRSTSGGK